MDVSDRIAALEARVTRLEAAAAPPPVVATAVGPRPVPASLPPFPPRSAAPAARASAVRPARQRARQPRGDWWSASHVAAVAGGALLLAAAAFFVTLAISRGWLSHDLQVAVAVTVGVALVGTGAAVLRGLRTVARRRVVGGVLVGVGAGIADLGVVAGVALYDPPVMGNAVGAVGVAMIAALVAVAGVRVAEPVLIAFGVGSGVAAPLLVSAPVTFVTAALVGAFLIAGALLVARRAMPWLALVMAVLTFPQASLLVDDRTVWFVGAALLGWWLALAAGPIALAWRSDRIAGWPLGTAIAGAGAVVGLTLLDQVERGLPREAAGWTLLALAVVHAVAALVAHLRSRAALGTWMLVLGAAQALPACVFLLDGRSLAASLAGEALVLLFAAERTRSLASRIAAAVAALAAVGQALRDAPPDALAVGSDALRDTLLAVALVLVLGLAAAAISRHLRGHLLVGSAGVAIYGAAIALASTVQAVPGTVDVRAQLAISALVLASLGALVLSPARRFVSLDATSVAVLGAIAKLVFVDGFVLGVVTPEALLYGNERPFLTVIWTVLAALAVAAVGVVNDELRPLGVPALAAVVGYGSSIALVSALTPDHLTRAQRSAPSAQLTLSAAIGLAGLTLIVIAVRRGWRSARHLGLAVLAVVAGKVVLLDIATLDAGYRVAAFAFAGLALIGAALLLARLDDQEYDRRVEGEEPSNDGRARLVVDDGDGAAYP